MGPIDKTTEDEYLLREPEAEYKSEYIDGRVTAMAGASEAHELIVWNWAAALGAQLAATPCRAFLGNMRVKVEAAQFYSYPDIAVVCEEPRYVDEKRATLLNPNLIVEVLSASTAGYDRGEKFSYYQKLPSLREYVLVSQDRMQVEQYVRQPDGSWRLQHRLSSRADLLTLGVGASISLDEMYRKVSV